MPCRLIISSAYYLENNYLTLLLISSSRCLGQQPASQYGSDRRPGGSVREGSLQSQDQVRPSFLWDGLQQGVLQQRQLCPRSCRAWTDPGYLRHCHGTGQLGSVRWLVRWMWFLPLRPRVLVRISADLHLPQAAELIVLIGNIRMT